MSEFSSERRRMTTATLDQRREEMRDLLQEIAGPVGLMKPMDRGTLRGFVSVRIPAMRLTIRDCTVNETNGRRWIGLPGKAQISADRELIKRDGKVQYTPTCVFDSKDVGDAFSTAVLAALDAVNRCRQTRRDLLGERTKVGNALIPAADAKAAIRAFVAQTAALARPDVSVLLAGLPEPHFPSLPEAIMRPLMSTDLPSSSRAAVSATVSPWPAGSTLMR